MGDSSPVKVSCIVCEAWRPLSLEPRLHRSRSAPAPPAPVRLRRRQGGLRLRPQVPPACGSPTERRSCPARRCGLSGCPHCCPHIQGGGRIGPKRFKQARVASGAGLTGMPARWPRTAANSAGSKYSPTTTLASASALFERTASCTPAAFSRASSAGMPG